MGKIKYKEFTKEEEKIYDASIELIKKNMKSGMSMDQACDAIEVKDGELKAIIADDFLKITIADMHHAKGKSFDAIAKELKIPMERIIIAYGQMIDDIINTNQGKFGFSDPESLGFSGPKGNA